MLHHAYLIVIDKPKAATPVKSVYLSQAFVAQISPGYVIADDTGAGHVTKRNSSLLARLSDCRQTHSQLLASNSTYDVTVYTLLGQQTVYHYDYNASTGELGKGQEWCYVPEDMRAWINGLPVTKREKEQTTDFKIFSVTKTVN